MPRKRKNEEIVDDEIAVTPRKSRKGTQEEVHHSPSSAAATPSTRKSILKSTPGKSNGVESAQATPTSLRRVLFSTPGKAAELDGIPGEDEEDTPTTTRNDRSALRKSRRTLLAHDEDDDWDNEGPEDQVALAILDEEDVVEDTQDRDSAPDTPSKTGRLRGRPKGRRRERTPSPPPDLPPHELYFFQNRTGANKTSVNTLPSHLLLNAEDYYAQSASHHDSHAQDIERLTELHRRAFDQWMFELEEGFNLCLYGYGSKRGLLMEFAEHMFRQTGQASKLIIINAYSPGLTIKHVLTTIAGVLLPKSLKLPAQPQALLDLILLSLSEPSRKSSVGLIFHSLDHANLRKSATQTMISRLAAHPAVSLVASCDNPNFPLLWDTQLSRQFQFMFHDATTFQPYKAEIDVVEDVNILLGRSRRSLNGKDGVGYVLKSLPENARSLFRILVAEQLTLADVEADVMATPFGEDSDPEDIIGVDDEEAAAAAEQHTPSRRGRGRPKKQPKPPKPTLSAPIGVEYRTLYHKAVEEFVCSSEVNFRTLLKEFHDHQMIESRKDALGTERLIVPFRREELETILEELV